MQTHVRALLASLLAVALFACSERPPVPPSDAEHDARYIGAWTGQVTQADGVMRSWRQDRKTDGTYEITFELRRSGNLEKTQIEKGFWWTRRDLFFEQNLSAMREPDIYQVEWVSPTKVRYSQVKKDPSGTESVGYSFEESKSSF